MNIERLIRITTKIPQSQHKHFNAHILDLIDLPPETTHHPDKLTDEEIVTYFNEFMSTFCPEI